MNLKLFAFLLPIVFHSFKSFSQNKHKDTTSDVTEIIDLVDSSSVFINRKSKFILLPKSIKGKQKDGRVVIQIRIAKTNEITDYSTQYCKISVGNKILQDFYYDSRTNKYIGKYDKHIMEIIEPEIKKYLTEQVVIKRRNFHEDVIIYKLSIPLK